MADLLNYGAGAAEGLDTYLARLLAQEKLAETTRSNQAEEGIKREGLKQNEWVKDELANERQTNTEAKRAAIDAESKRQTDEETYRNDPNTPPALKNFLNLRRVVPKGETIPPQLFQEGGGVNSEQKSYKLTDANLAKQLGKKPGDVIDADYNPRTNKILYRGTDVTSGVDHYEKPPAPDRVLIQSGSGYMTRDDARKKLGAGEDVPLATTSSSRTMSEGAQMLRPHVSKLGQRAAALDQQGMFGPVMSRVRGLMAKYGTSLDSDNADESAKAWQQLGTDIARDPELNKDRNVGAFAASLGLMATGAGRVHGGARGGGSPLMLEHFKALLSDAGTLPMFLGRLDALDEYLGTYAAGPGGGGNDATPEGDAYSEYLKRTQPK